MQTPSRAEIAAAGVRLKSRIHARKIEAPKTIRGFAETSMVVLIDEALRDVIAPDGTPFLEWAAIQAIDRRLGEMGNGETK